MQPPSHSFPARLCSNLAWAINGVFMLRRWGMFIEYCPRNCQRWWQVDWFRDATSWNLHLGKFELIVDRPLREDLR